MSGGGKGGSSSTKVEIPDWLDMAARGNVERAKNVSEMGYRPYFGLDVAAFDPATNQATQAFGLDPVNLNFAEPLQYGGVRGFSSYPLFMGEQQAWRNTMPGQAEAYDRFFVNPQTGEAPALSFSQPQEPQMTDAQRVMAGVEGGNMAMGHRPGGMFNRGPGLDDGMGNPDRSLTGYSGIGDMFDGGGPGRSGDTFQGGGFVSDVGNNMGGPGNMGGGGGLLGSIAGAVF